jgi:GNAT superfamily N-acetyltransferase
LNSFEPLRWRQYTIRAVAPADIDTIMFHRRKMFLDMGNKDNASFAEAMRNARIFFSERLANGRYCGWLVETERGEIVVGAGVIVFDYHANPLDPSPQRPMVVNVYTERGHRRQGIAKKMMELIIHWCRSEGFNSVVLHASNEGRPLYDALGFKQTNEMQLLLRQKED